MKILVTGGCGFIGHNVVSTLDNLGHQILIVDNKTNYGIIPRDEIEHIMSRRCEKISSRVNIREMNVESRHINLAFEQSTPDIVLHMASFPRQTIVNKNPMSGARVMCEGLLNLLEYSLQYGVKKFVYVSSSMVYGDFKDGVVESQVCKPRGQYAIMKYMGELLVADYTRRHGMAHTIIRPSAVYGELDVEDRVISKFMLSALRNDVLTVNGEHEYLDFTYIDDTVSGIIASVLSDNTNNKTYNITRGRSRSLLDAAKLAINISGKGTVKIQGRDINFPSRGSLCIDAARQDFGFNPTVDIEEGFSRYYDWLISNEYWKNKIS